MDLVRAYVFLEKPNPPVARRKTVVLVERGNDSFADVQKLGFETDEHPRQRGLPWCLIYEPPAPVLQALGAGEHDGIFDALAAGSSGLHVIFQHVEMPVLRILFIAEIFK